MHEETYRKTYPILIRYSVHIRQIVQKITLLQISFCYIPLERGVSVAIPYNKCAQIFVLSVNKSPIRYAFRNPTESEFCAISREN